MATDVKQEQVLKEAIGEINHIATLPGITSRSSNWLRTRLRRLRTLQADLDRPALLAGAERS